TESSKRRLAKSVGRRSLPNMRRLLASWMLAVALLTAVPITQSGCSTTAQQAEYRTLKAVALTVDTALKAYADAVVAGKVDAATQAKALDAKARYADAFTAAVAAAKSSMSPAPMNVQQLADSLVTIINAATRK